MKKDPSLKSQATALFIGNLVGTVVQFLMPAIIVRLISQEDFGVFRQFALVAGTFFGLLGMGYKTSLFYFYPIANKVGKQKIIQQTEFLFVINLFIFLLTFYFFGNRILEYLNFGQFVGVKAILLLFISCMVLSSLLGIIFTLEKNVLLNKIFPPLEKIAYFFIFLIIVLIIPGFMGPIIALVVYGGIRLLFFSFYFFKYFKPLYRLDWNRIKEQLIYSLPFGLALILDAISTKFDKFFINQYISPKDYGIYSIAFLSIPILNQIFQSIRNVIVPEITIYMNANKIEEATNLWQKAVDKTTSITIPAVFLFWLLAKEIITILYTVKYVEAANYYRIFILMFFVSMFSYNIILRASNKTKYILMSSVFGAIVTVIIGFIIIPKFGLYGAIITAVIGAIVPMLISMHIERKIMGLSIMNWVNWKNIGINFFSCFLIGIPIFLLKDYITNIYIRTALAGLVFVLFVSAFQIRFGMFLFVDQLNKLKKNFNI